MGLSPKVALWTNNTLPLDFPSIVWKRLVGLEPTIEDLNVCSALSLSLSLTCQFCRMTKTHPTLRLLYELGN